MKFILSNTLVPRGRKSYESALTGRVESLRASPYRSWCSLGPWRVTGESLNKALLSINRYWGSRKRRSLVCSKMLGSGLWWLCMDVWTLCVLLASTTSTWLSVIVGNDAKWLFSWMLLWQLEVPLFLTVADTEVLDSSNSFELRLTSGAHQDTVSPKFEEYWLPHKNETCEPDVINAAEFVVVRGLKSQAPWFWGAESLGREQSGWNLRQSSQNLLEEPELFCGNAVKICQTKEVT